MKYPHVVLGVPPDASKQEVMQISVTALFGNDKCDASWF